MHVTSTAYTGPAVRPQYQAAVTSEDDPKSYGGQPKPLAYRDHSEMAWKYLVRGRPQAGVLAATSKRAADVARTKPVAAKRVGLGKQGTVVAGYLHNPTRFSFMSRDERFRRLRWVELARIANHRVRHGIALDGDAWLRAMASVSSMETLCHWCWDFLPDVGPDQIRAALDDAEQNEVRFSAAELGDLIGLTVDERENIDIRTIRPAGMSERAFGAYSRDRKRELDKERVKAKRRDEGIEPRRKGASAKEEASARGVSVRTIYNERKKSKDAEANAGVSSQAVHSKIAYGCETDMRDFRLQTPSASVEMPCDDAADAAILDQPRQGVIWFTAAFEPSAAQWRIPIVAANSDPAIARLGARVAAHAAAHRKAAQVFAMMRRAA